MKSFVKPIYLTKLISRFLGEMHRFDAGHTLPMLHAQKLTTPQLAALEFVFERRTISEVATFLGLSRPATSQMIHKLVGRGLIRRSEGVTDRREKAVVLTAKGRVLLERVAAARTARLAASISCLPARTANRLKGALREVIERLETSGSSSRPRRKSR
jgi:DNA-binding MarR family transcriptional regulator